MKYCFTVEIDRIDKKLLKALQDNGRLTNAELAERVNISAATCHRRVQRLFSQGYIKSVRALIEPAKIEMGAIVMVGVILDRSTPESFSNFEASVKTIPIILSCYLVAGEFDYLLKIRVKDMADFNKLHSDKLLRLPEVRQLRTYFVMKEVIDDAPLPF